MNQHYTAYIIASKAAKPKWLFTYYVGDKNGEHYFPLPNQTDAGMCAFYDGEPCLKQGKYLYFRLSWIKENYKEYGEMYEKHLKRKNIK